MYTLMHNRKEIETFETFKEACNYVTAYGKVFGGVNLPLRHYGMEIGYFNLRNETFVSYLDPYKSYT